MPSLQGGDLAPEEESRRIITPNSTNSLETGMPTRHTSKLPKYCSMDASRVADMYRAHRGVAGSSISTVDLAHSPLRRYRPLVHADQPLRRGAIKLA